MPQCEADAPGLIRKLRSSGAGIDGTVFWSTAGSAFEKISLTRV